jgi:hypothetical protein
MFAIKFNGTTRRPVIIFGPWTLKLARNPLGRRCNQYEAYLFQRSSLNRKRLLCPVLWVSRKGLLLVMATAGPMGPTEYDYSQLVKEWDALPGEDGFPFEPKPADWGRYHGRPVAVDYSTLTDLAAKDDCKFRCPNGPSDAAVSCSEERRNRPIR